MTPQEETALLARRADRSNNLMSISLVVLSAALLILISLVFYIIRVGRENTAKTACYNNFNSLISDTQSDFMSTALVLVFDGFAVTFAPSELEANVALIREKGDAYEARVAERNEWMANGRPLPCPVNSDGSRRNN